MAIGDVISRLAVSLTLETAAFEKGATRSQKHMQQMQRKFADMGKRIAVGAAAIGTATGVVVSQFRDMGRQAVESAIEIERLSSVANASTDEFQKAAYAAKAVGIESEKLADIYKDVNDKIGDFVATGGGAMKDFFENIAPKVGVTAEQFKKLSGPDALQLYVSSLEKAGLNQQEMTFYMEALASDATALLPLMRDNGKAMGKFAEEAEKTGLILSSEEIAAAKEVAHNLGLINAQVEAKQNKQLLKHSEALVKVEESVGEFKLGLIKAVAGIIDFGDKLDAGTQRTHENLVTIRKAVEDFGTRIATALDGAAASTNAALISVRDRLADFASRMVEIGREMIAGLVRGIKSAASAVGDAIVGTASAAVTRAKEFLQIKSPSRVFMEIGGHIGDGLAMGIAGKFGTVGDASKQLAQEVTGAFSGIGVSPATGSGPTPEASNDNSGGEGVISQAERWRQVLQNVGGTFGNVASTIADLIAGIINPAVDTSIDKFSQMQNAMAGITSLFQDIFGKKAGKILGGLFQIGASVAQAFSGGGGFGGFRADGGPMSAGKTYMVGERGPELVTPRYNSMVHSNEQLRSGRAVQRVEIIDTTGLFRFKVNGYIQEAAPGIAQGGAQLAGQQSAFLQSRRW